MKTDRRLFSLLLPKRLPFSITILAGVAGGVVTVIQAWVLSRIVDGVFLQGSSLRTVIPSLAILLTLILFRAASIWLAETSASRLAIHIRSDLRDRLFAKLNELGPAYLRRSAGGADPRTGEIVQILTEGVDSLDAYFSQYLPQLVLTVLVPLTFLILIFPIDILTGAVLLITAPLIPIFMTLIGNRAKELTRKQWTLLGRMSAHFLDVLQGLATLKVFGRSKAQIKVITQVGERYRETTMGILRVAFLSSLVLEWVATISTAVVAVEIGLRLLYGRIDFFQAFFILLLAPDYYMILRQLGARFHAGMAGVEAASRIFAILEEQTVDRRRKTETELRPPASIQNRSSTVYRPPSITFKDVHSKYDFGSPALEGVSFAISPGEVIALVGPSGAGKSTLVGLMLGYLHPQSGCIEIDGFPLESLELEEWRSRIAWVPQDPYLFDLSVADNIRLGKVNTGQEQVVTAAKLAGAHAFIMNLPRGYDTRIGERGSRLSGGQAQRIALARAFLKDCPILILDEAMTNLDTDSIADLREVIRSLSQNRTTLIVTHRLETIQNADRIIVLEEGRITETGTQDQLVANHGPYGRLLSSFQYRDCVLPSPLPPPPSLLSPSSPLPLSYTSPKVPSYRSPLPSVTKSLGSYHALTSLIRLLSPFKWRVLLSALLGCATIASGIGLLGTSAYLISAAAMGPSIAVLQVPIVAVRTFGLFRGIFRYLERLVSHDTTFRILVQLRVRFFAALEPLAPARLIQVQSADLLSRIHADVASLEEFFVRGVSPLLVWFLTAITIGWILASVSPVLAVIALVFHASIALVLTYLIHHASRQSNRVQVELRSSLYTVLVDGIQGMADLQAYGASGAQSKRVSSLDRALADAEKRLDNISGLHSAAENALAYFALWSVLVVGIHLIQVGRLDGVNLGTLILATLASFEAVNPLLQAAQTLERDLSAARRLDSVVGVQPTVSDPKIPLILPEIHDLEVNHLSFSYPALQTNSNTVPWDITPESLPPLTQENALTDISFSLPQGKRLAIVGPSGSGKTTLVNLLLRVWEFQEGHILLNGIDFRCYKQDDVRSVMSLVTQRTHLFNGTITDNLRLARPAASHAEIVRAAKRAQVHNFIVSLPQGYRTWIGEQGLRLSGGERQRLAIARAFLKDAPILILDEPTAHLDTINRREILQTIVNLAQDKSILLITHSMELLETMDEILVMKDGAIIDRGRHSELMKYCEFYRRSWELRNSLPTYVDTTCHT